MSRQTQLSEFKEYKATVKALEKLEQKHLELILKLRGAKKIEMMRKAYI